MDYLMLTLLAHLSAHRRLLINLYSSGLIEAPEPVKAACALREQFASNPTQAPESGSGLDPATSDLLAAMTDEAIDDLLGRVVMRLRDMQDDEEHDAADAPAVRRRRAVTFPTSAKRA